MEVQPNLPAQPERIVPEGAVEAAMRAGLQRLADEGKTVIVHRDGNNIEVLAQELLDKNEGD